MAHNTLDMRPRKTDDEHPMISLQEIEVGVEWQFDGAKPFLVDRRWDFCLSLLLFIFHYFDTMSKVHPSVERRTLSPDKPQVLSI